MKNQTSAVETLADRLNYLLPNAIDNVLLRWPPDVFCLCATLLQSSGAYSVVVEDNPPHNRGRLKKTRAIEVKELGKKWRKAATGTRPLPAKLTKWWHIIQSHRAITIDKVSDHIECTAALLNLFAAADEACFGLGLFFHTNKDSDAFEKEAERRLLATTNLIGGATLCKEIAPSKGRVLPKMHTPQNGLTIRSLSHHLAHAYSPDVKPEWLSAANDVKHHCFNLLIIPWPFHAEPKQFQPTRTQGIADHLGTHPYGLFTFQAPRGPSIGFVRSLLEESEKTVGKVDGIVFPELSMSRAEFDHLATEFVTDTRLLIAGVGTPAIAPGKCGTNEARIEVGARLRPDLKMKASFAQKKHHRWKLTKSQILQYGLASTLHPSADWWEHIAVAGRTISFVTMRPWLTMSVLICEDLARPDPVGDVLRSVGPNLIVALLCDGPQLMSRWPGRYAGALADDPGSSVLTLTSLGASKLSKPIRGGQNRNRNVALWRDARNGATEIEMPDGASALLLNLSVEYIEEWTADGRGDGGVGGYPTLAGVHPIYVKQESESSL